MAMGWPSCSAFVTVPFEASASRIGRRLASASGLTTWVLTRNSRRDGPPSPALRVASAVTSTASMRRPVASLSRWMPGITQAAWAPISASVGFGASTGWVPVMAQVVLQNRACTSALRPSIWRARTAIFCGRMLTGDVTERPCLCARRQPSRWLCLAWRPHTSGAGAMQQIPTMTSATRGSISAGRPTSISSLAKPARLRACSCGIVASGRPLVTGSTVA